MNFPTELLDRAARVRLLLSDIDGVWTEGFIHVHADGSESCDFHVHDGYGLVLLQRAGVEVAVITGRDNPAVAARVARLGIAELRMGSFDKGERAEEIVRARGLMHEEIAAIGDDLPDLQMFAQAGLCFAPPEAVPAVRAAADHVTRACAGRGALREVCDLLLLARGAHPAAP